MPLTGNAGPWPQKMEKCFARKLEAYANNGGYASHGHAICANCGNVFKDIYQDRLGAEIDWLHGMDLHCHCGSMRGYGIPEAAFYRNALRTMCAGQSAQTPWLSAWKTAWERDSWTPPTALPSIPTALRSVWRKGRSTLDGRRSAGLMPTRQAL